MFPNFGEKVKVLKVPGVHFRQLIQKQIDSCERLIEAVPSLPLPPEHKPDDLHRRLQIALDIQSFIPAEHVFEISVEQYQDMWNTFAPFMTPDEYATAQAKKAARKADPRAEGEDEDNTDIRVVAQ